MDPASLSQDPTSKRLLLSRNRHRRKLRDNILGITKPAIRRLARRGGVKRMKLDIYDEIRTIVKSRLTQIISQLVVVLGSGDTYRHERKTITTRDVVFVLDRIGHPLYGFADV